MAERRPLVLISGEMQELPAADTLPVSGGGGSTPPRQWVDRTTQTGSSVRYHFVDTLLSNTFAAATLNSVNNDVLWPFTGRMTADAFAFEVTTAGAGVSYALGLYDCNAQGRPNNLLRSATGNFGTSGLNVVTFASLALDGMYWIGIAASASSGYGLRAGSTDPSSSSHMFGQRFGVNGNSYDNCFTQTRTYGAFPSTYSFSTGTQPSQFGSLVALRQVQI